MVLGSALELCGTNSVYAYASSVFRQAGIPEGKVQYAIVGTGSCELLVACVSVSLSEFVVGLWLGAAWSPPHSTPSAPLLQSPLPWMPYLTMFCVFALILSFGLGPAGVTGILAMELFDQKAQPAASMVCRVLMWTMLFLVGLGFPFIMEGLSHFLYVPFLGVCVCGTICTGFFLPKTKGKTFLEISEELHRLNFPRQSQGPEWLGPEVIQATEL
uniref:Major facilitator superfamily (MFS) profile domain-containing protein n=1 Tax=Lynx canadensis TaxID=61383 RepID=A0A667HR45_LYNCA